MLPTVGLVFNGGGLINSDTVRNELRTLRWVGFLGFLDLHQTGMLPPALSFFFLR